MPETYRYNDCISAKLGISFYISQLKQTKRSCDQEGLCDLFVLSPQKTSFPPLLLLGGMGPLAGALAFKQACEFFHNDRMIILYQASSTPDRTQVIQSILRARTMSKATVLVEHFLLSLERALKQGMTSHQAAYQEIECVLVCNSAHYFLPHIKQRIYESHDPKLNSLRFHSIIDATAAKLTPSVPVLLLATTGALQGKIYDKALHKAKAPFVLPSAFAQRKLMQAIYQGVKSSNNSITREAGYTLIKYWQENLHNITTTIAACTEIPIIFDALSHDSQEVRQFLRDKQIINPMTCTFEHIQKDETSQLFF